LFRGRGFACGPAQQPHSDLGTMGNAAPQVKTVGGGAPAQRDPSAFLQLDLPRLIKKHELGGKFMKSFLCRVEDGVPVVVKVYVRHDGEQIGDLARARVRELGLCPVETIISHVLQLQWIDIVFALNFIIC
jgi:hypothetical protein